MKLEVNLTWNIPSTKMINALIAVAHPDDETIFCGGTILTLPNWKWTLICFTYKENSIRIKQLQEAVDHYKRFGINMIQCITLGQEDKPTLSDHEILTWKNDFQSYNFSADIIFTHNSIGEYNHNGHISVNKIMHQLHSNVWEFICPGAKNFNQPYKNKTKNVSLTKEILTLKKSIFNSCYKTEQYIWNNLPDIMDYEFNYGPEVFTSG